MLRNLIRHNLIGNDTHPAVVAATRALVGAVLFGGANFFREFADEESVKVLVTAFFEPFIGFLIIRAGLEGAVDVWKNGKK